MAAHPYGSNKGRPAVTKYEVIKNFMHFTLVKIHLLTGRTNQIRVHFFALGNPVAGDTLYELKTKKPKVKIPRILLHASKLSFTDFKGDQQNFESSLPEEFSEVFDQLK